MRRCLFGILVEFVRDEGEQVCFLVRDGTREFGMGPLGIRILTFFCVSFEQGIISPVPRLLGGEGDFDVGPEKFP